MQAGLTASHQSAICLVAINARFSHASLGIRSLLSNMGELRSRTCLMEFTIREAAVDIAETIAAAAPIIAGIGVYIWNRLLVEQVVEVLHSKHPELKIVLGGPEISHTLSSSLAARVDCVVCGEGETAWPRLCHAILQGKPFAKVIKADRPEWLSKLRLPQHEFSEVDLAHRTIAFETSRGCPNKCEFCLSSIDSGVRYYDECAAHEALRSLIRCGARRIKLVDRSFNLCGARACRLLDVILNEPVEHLELQLEMTPDRIGPDLRERLKCFPAGRPRVEVGVQTFNADVAARIGRPLELDAVEEGIRHLVDVAHVHVHADLIAGLPGESLESFADGFNRLYALHPAEIQVGLLKLLPGTALIRHIAPWGLRFSPDPPYTILQSSVLSPDEVNTVRLFAAHWERFVNRGHFRRTMALFLDSASAPWETFLMFSHRLGARFGGYGIGLEDGARIILEHLVESGIFTEKTVRDLLREDYYDGGRRRSIPAFLRDV